jgi:hypothetical protein
MAALLGLARFPDQSQVNRLLWAFSTDHIYLFKGMNSQRPRKLLTKVDGEKIFWQVDNGANQEPAWMCDLEMQKSRFRGTILAKIGLGRLIRQGMQIPARVTKKAEKWIVEMPRQHHLVKQLLKSWAELSRPDETRKSRDCLYKIWVRPEAAKRISHRCLNAVRGPGQLGG